jgi:hypothetical protein
LNKGTALQPEELKEMRTANMASVALLACLVWATPVLAGDLSARTGKVVSVDVNDDVVTLKADSGDTVTMRAEGYALAMLGELTPGQRVRWAYRDDSNGQHQAIIWIKIL